MSLDQMKSAILKVYSGKNWENKVKKMSDNQILAIYSRFLASGKLKN